MSLSFLICIAGPGPSEESQEPLTGPPAREKSETRLGRRGGSGGEGAGLGSGRSRGSTNQERHWGEPPLA